MGSTEELLKPRLAARLSFCKGLHARMGAVSPMAWLSADIVEQIVDNTVLDPVVVSAEEFSGAHTGNPQYFTRTADALVLRTVCWLEISVSARHVPRGRYRVLLDMTAGWGYTKYTLPTRVLAADTTATPDSRVWSECCPEYIWDPPEKGRGLLCCGEINLSATSDVQVRQFQTEGNWKDGTQWHQFVLVPLPKSAPPAEPGWVLGAVLDI